MRTPSSMCMWLGLAAALVAMRTAAVIPENDNFATRTVLFGTNLTATGSNVDAGHEPFEPDPYECGGKSVWWSWTAPADGWLTLSTAASSLDTTLAVFTGDALTNLTLAAFNDTETNTSSLGLNVMAGTSYQIDVDGFLNATGSVCLHLELGTSVPPPLNDDFANRITLTGSHLSNITGSNIAATREPGEPFHTDELGGKSVWWSWTAQMTGSVTISTKGSSFDTILAVYTGTSLSNLVFVAGNDEDPGSPQGYVSLVTFNVTGGTVYQIAVDGFDDDSGSVRLNLDMGTAIPVPANDNFASRTVLSGNIIVLNSSNYGASSEPGEPLHLLTYGGKSVWWSWTAPGSGSVTLSASNDVVDTILCVYRGTELTNLAFVAGNDEDYSTAVECDSKVLFNATAGVTYQIVVDGFDSSEGPFTLRLVQGLLSAVPTNNNFASRATLSGTSIGIAASNVGATLEPDEPLHNHSYGGKSVWWKWTSPAAGYVTISTIGSEVDTLLAVYTGTALSNLVEVASDDESGGIYTSLVKFNTKANVIYQIAVDGFDGDSGVLTLRLNFAAAAYSLTGSANPAAAGSVRIDPAPDQSGKYAPGSVATLTATAVYPYAFTVWTGSNASTNNPLTLTLSSNKTVTAQFSIPPATLTVPKLQTADTIRRLGFSMLLNGPTNFSYALERSTNLSTWTAFKTNLVATNNFLFRDEAVSNAPARVYRARRLP